MTFGEKLIALRKTKNWSQNDLAEKLNTHGSLIGKYERNESRPSIDVAKKLADIFEVSIDYLADEKGKIKPTHDNIFFNRLSEIEDLPEKEKEYLKFLIDAVIRDAKARKTYH